MVLSRFWTLLLTGVAVVALATAMLAADLVNDSWERAATNDLIRDRFEVEAIFSNVRAPSTERRIFSGTDAASARSSFFPGQVDLAYAEHGGVFLGTYDGGAELFAVRRYEIEGNLAGLGLAEAPDAAVAVWSATGRGASRASIRLDLGRDTDRFDREAEALASGDVAYSGEVGWMLAAVGSSSPAPGVVGYATDGRRRSRIPVAGPLTTAGAAPDPAVVDTGRADTPYVVFWDALDAGAGRIEASLITCR